MIKKVISGGQEGVERAALDMALKFMIDCGGWIPHWRAGEDDTLVRRYRMVVLNGANHVQATEQNVMNADGVLIVTRGELSGNAALYVRLAERHHRTSMVLDLSQVGAFEAARKAEAWIRDHRIEVLAVTGSPSGTDNDVYGSALSIFEALYHLMVVNPRQQVLGPIMGATPADRRLETFVEIPETVDEAVAALQSVLSFQDRTRIANMKEGRINTLLPKLGAYINNEFRLWQGNPALVADCRARSASGDEEPSTVIIRALWLALRTSGQVLRVVK